MLARASASARNADRSRWDMGSLGRGTWGGQVVCKHRQAHHRLCCMTLTQPAGFCKSPATVGCLDLMHVFLQVPKPNSNQQCTLAVTTPTHLHARHSSSRHSPPLRPQHRVPRRAAQQLQQAEPVHQFKHSMTHCPLVQPHPVCHSSVRQRPPHGKHCCLTHGRRAAGVYWHCSQGLWVLVA